MDDDDASRRFFPTIYDEDFGFRLHEADNAVNKVLCTARRHTAARDAVDLATIVQKYAPLGPLVWAMCGKDTSFTPPKAFESIRRHAFGYADVELRTVRTEDGQAFTRQDLRHVLEPALREAAIYCDEIAPVELDGWLFVDGREIPTAATARQLADGKVIAMPLKDFPAKPEFPG